jgi:plasmid stabilization system protein ParE
MGKLIWTEESERWLRDIFDYIAADNPAAARGVVLGILARARLLRQFPEMGHIYRNEAEGVIRILTYGHYRIAYLLKSKSSIEILGVYHGALDLDRYLP